MPPFKCFFNPIGVRVYALLLRVFTRSLALLVYALKGCLCPVFKGAYPESRFARLPETEIYTMTYEYCHLPSIHN